MSPVVSVVLPCYNHQNFIQASVESVLAQSVAEIEIIAIDDCSSDATAQILEGFDDPRLTLVRHEQNHGSAETINEGIRKSKAPYVAILNSDDLYHRERLAYCLEFAQKTNSMLVGTDLELIDGLGEVNQDRTSIWIDWYRELKQTYRISGDLTATLIAGNLFISTSNFFLHRSLFDSIGPLTDYRYVQDYEYLLRAVAAHPQRVHWRDNKLLRYRMHASNTISDDHLAPNVQTLEILTHWMPDLAVGEHTPQRLRLFETHVLKLAGYIETASKNTILSRWQADVRIRDQQITAFETVRAELTRMQNKASNLESALAFARKRNADLEANINRLITRRDELNSLLETQRQAIALIRSSVSFRLGYGLVQPLRWIQRLAHKRPKPRP